MLSVATQVVVVEKDKEERRLSKVKISIMRNPQFAFWSGVMMLDHLGEKEAAARLMRAIERVTGEGTALTRDLGGTATTAEATAAVVAALDGV